jgi:prephenate dehydrogenase
MTIYIIGIGLIGGSMALALKEKGFAPKVLGWDKNPAHAQKALELSLVDGVEDIDAGVGAADIIIVTIPVDAAVKLLPRLLDKIQPHQIVMDAGSSKEAICEAVKDHPARNRFVATHPMWGTEFSGPEAAVQGAFTGRAVVICDKEKSDAYAVETIEKLYQTLGMHLLYMNAAAHDVHVAYVSHISHITSFALANTVLQKEKEEQAIFELASGGFASTVRLAKSNPAMWVPIFQQNKENVLDVLNEHITQLRKFKSSLEKENWDYLKELIDEANGIKRILG